METAKASKPKFYCNPGALNKEERARYSEVTKKLKADRTGLEELTNGYELNFRATSESIREVAEFIAYERACCPFLNFEMAVVKEKLVLRMTGDQGVKDFIRAEFGL